MRTSAAGERVRGRGGTESRGRQVERTDAWRVGVLVGPPGVLHTNDVRAVQRLAGNGAAAALVAQREAMLAPVAVQESTRRSTPEPVDASVARRLPIGVRASVGRRAFEPPTVPVQRFGALEHKVLGDRATRGREIELAPGLKVTYGDLVSLGGDLFGSVEEVMDLAKVSGAGKGTRGEIVYAVNEEVRGKDQPKLKLGWDQSAKAAVKERYYKLAADNVTHFVNIDKGDTGLGVKARHAKRALRVRSPDRQEGTLPGQRRRFVPAEP